MVEAPETQGMPSLIAGSSQLLTVIEPKIMVIICGNCLAGDYVIVKQVTTLNFMTFFFAVDPLIPNGHFFCQKLNTNAGNQQKLPKIAVA